MECLVLLVIVAAFFWMASTTSGAEDPRRSRMVDVPPAPPADAAGSRPPPRWRRVVSKRGAARKAQRVKFRDVSTQQVVTVDEDASGLVDALTGAALRPEAGLYLCQQCGVYYQTASYELVKSENRGRCVACRQLGIVAVARGVRFHGRNAEVGVVTLADYRSSLGLVATFEGTVRAVRENPRGHFALMFEDKGWTRGFKMMVFQCDVSRVGGKDFLNGLAGKCLRVRGLLKRTNRFGDEIIVTDPAMILSTA